MAPFNRSHTIFYWPAIVNIALSCNVFIARQRDIDIAKVCPSISPSVHYVPVSDENGLTYQFFTIR